MIRYCKDVLAKTLGRNYKLITKITMSCLGYVAFGFKPSIGVLNKIHIPRKVTLVISCRMVFLMFQSQAMELEIVSFQPIPVIIGRAIC